MKQKPKQFTFKEFQLFLATECYNEKEYGDCKYDRKIYNWFELGKPKKIEFYDKSGKTTRWKKLKTKG